MSALAGIEKWSQLHHHKTLDYLRIVLGVILFVKGIAFIVNSDQVVMMVSGVESTFISFLISHYVIIGYLIGGFLVAIGMLTRLAVLIQIPSVLGSIILPDFHKHLFALNSQLVYSILVLALLLFYLIYGAGEFSMDNLMKKDKNISD